MASFTILNTLCASIVNNLFLVAFIVLAQTKNFTAKAIIGNYLAKLANYVGH